MDAFIGGINEIDAGRACMSDWDIFRYVLFASPKNSSSYFSAQF
jgi:hypothetical protein